MNSILGFVSRLVGLAVLRCGVGIAFAVICVQVPEVSEARDLQVEAIIGRPFGVATLTLPPSAEISEAAALNRFQIIERNGRAFYPAFTAGRVRRLLGELLGADLNNGPAALSVTFLFRGDEPLDLTILAPNPIRIEVVPRADARRFDRQLAQWWRDYNAAARQAVDEGDYPPVVQTYLTSMLARRMNLEAPLLSKLTEQKPSEFQRDIEMLLGLERLRLATLKQTMLGDINLGAIANLPPPREIVWGPQVEPPFDPAAEIEPIALRVPAECFYIRFGKFSNYVWLSRLLDEYGGDIGSMVTLRGLKSAGDERVQKQLALKQSAIGDLFGDTVIADVALIGRDLYLQEGAAIGILFQARNLLLGTNLNSDRQAALAEERKHGATLETVRIANRDVSLLSTPDNRVRSFYLVDGDYHLVTNSRSIVEQFLRASETKNTIGASAEFKHARTQMPTNRDDTVFVYFSSAFFRGLASPQYQIELARRMQSLTDIQLIQLASLAAKAERRRGDTIEELIAAELLPPGFGRRADGSGPIMTNREILDSMRGAIGSFTPIPDIAIKSVTPFEAERCNARAAFFESQWQQMDPLMVSVKRYSLDAKDPRVAAGDRLERIVIQGNVSPLDEGKYGKYLSMLGPPSRERIAPAANDIISVQAQLRGGLVSPSVPPHHLVLGIQDSPPATDLRPTGLFKTLKILQTTPGYLGAWPKPGFLDMLPLGLGGGRPDPAGYSQLLFGLWRRQWGDFSALSFDRRVLDYVTPQLRIEPTESDAQIRVHVGDLAKSQLVPWLNAMSYERANQASLGNVRLLHTLTQQMQVSNADARRVAEEILDAKLVCTLGGEYEFQKLDEWSGQWRSTAMVDRATDRVPEKYRAPILGWFRGLDTSLIKMDGRLLVHAELDMQRNVSEPKVELPFFNLFGGDKKPEAKTTPEAKPTPAKKPEPLPPPKPALLPVPKAIEP